MKRSKMILDGAKCDICHATPDIIIDAPTMNGPWAHMCQKCFDIGGRKGSLGTIHSTVSVIVEQEMSFDEWMTQTDVLFSRKHEGMGVEDLLGDWSSRDMFDSGMSPSAAAIDLASQCGDEWGGMYEDAFG